METKKLFIELDVRDGERVHTHRVLTETTCEDINFAGQWYASHYWGETYRDGNSWYAWGGEIAITLKEVKELTKDEFKLLNKIFYED